LFDLSFNLRSNPFDKRDDDIDQSINIIKNILYVPYGSQGSQWKALIVISRLTKGKQDGDKAS